MLSKKFKTFLALSGTTKWLICKAVVISAFVKFALSFLPFKVVLKWLGKINVESDENSNPDSIETRTNIKTAIEICKRYTFWKNKCFTLAVTCKLLLTKYNLPSTVYIGFYKDEAGKYKGHAWLRSYDMILTGDNEINKFTIQSFFS